MWTKLTNLLPAKTLVKVLTNVAICVLAVAGTYFWHEGKVHEVENRVRIEMTQEYKRQIDQLTVSAIKSESELKDQLRKVEDEKQIQKAIDADRINDLIASLRNRPERPTSQSNPPGDTCNCKGEEGATGVQLYRPDAEFLTGFSGMATELQTELKVCYRKYDEVKAASDKFMEDNK